MKFDDDSGSMNNNSSSGDLFELALNRQASYGPTSTAGHRSSTAQYRVLELDARVLASLNPSEVFIVKYPSPLVRAKFYKNMIPEIKIHLSPHCRRFFHEEDFEFEYLKAGHCPCCRVREVEALNDPSSSSNNSNGDDDDDK